MKSPIAYSPPLIKTTIAISKRLQERFNLAAKGLDTAIEEAYLRVMSAKTDKSDPLEY